MSIRDFLTALLGTSAAVSFTIAIYLAYIALCDRFADRAASQARYGAPSTRARASDLDTPATQHKPNHKEP